MASLGELFCNHADELVQRWYGRWREEGAARPDLSEAVLKDHLAVQLRAIGSALRDGGAPDASPRKLWETHERLDPEQRVRDDVPIDEVVREYAYLVEEVRSWLDARGEQVSVEDYSFFSIAIFELVAESARRYAKYQAEQVSRERAEYVAGIAHQLRTPVSVLKFHVHRMERGLETLDAQAVERVRRTVSRLSRLVDGLLRIERFKPEELPVNPQPLSPAQVIDELIADYEHDAQRKQLRLEVHVNRSARMQADPDLLVDALGNLIQNAIKFTEKGFVRVSMKEREDGVTFRVEDSGPGISAEVQQKLFQPIQPGMPGGAGLGLSIASRAARAQGGALEVQSKPGRGSTFQLRLPWVVSPRQTQAPEEVPSALH